jgi:hypothetical protein
MYILGEGIMAFYYRLMWYAAQMVQSPDQYMFKKHFIMRLPKEVFDYLLEMPEVSPIAMVEVAARSA